MTRHPRIVIVLSLLALGCNERAEQAPSSPPPAPVPAPSAPPAPPAPPAPAQPTVAPEGEPSPVAAQRVECRGGEVVVTWQSAAGADAKAQTAKLTFAAAGHRAWSYDFAYEGGVLTSARHRISSWSFAGGDVDAPKTNDKIVERRYELEGGKLVSCTERRGEGSGDAIEQLVQAAPAKDIGCKLGAPVVELARHARAATANADTAWLSAACETDKSSALKL